MTKPIRLGLLTSYAPRRCGIATFTESLLTAIGRGPGPSETSVVAVSSMNAPLNYGNPVSFVIDQEEAGDYRRAAEHLNSRVDVVSLQHEFGLFGGADGEYILGLAERLDRPLITTLHTVLRNPSANQLRIVNALCRMSAVVMVMTEHTRRLLRERYDTDGCRIEVLPHGVPAISDEERRGRGVELFAGRKVILSAGLLSPSKGTEIVVDALADVVAEHPDALYVVLGATHPEVRRRDGEQYRESLVALADSHGVSDNLVFVDEFVPETTLVQYLLRADIFVTPHHSREQSSSGTLTYAMAAGNAILSTPYPYARELLADGHGILVEHGNAKAMARAIRDVFGDDTLKETLQAKTFARSREMLWSAVADRFLGVAAEVASVASQPLAARSTALPRPALDHLIRLTDDTGIVQHAIGPVPDRGFGYCTDDNARALQFAVAELRLRPGEDIRRVFDTAFAFVCHAFNVESGRFRNFMGFDRRWLDESGSDDTQGRAIQALAHVAAANIDGGYQVAALKRLGAAFERGAAGTTSPRAVAYAALGLHAYLAVHPGDSGMAANQRALAASLRRLTTPVSGEWPWPEPALTYENGRFPEALIACGRDTGDDGLVEAGLDLAEWLFDALSSPTGSHLSLVGSSGWWVNGGDRAQFDQQAVEIPGLVGAALQAYAVTSDDAWLERALLAYRWFFGANDVGVALYEPATGGCYDGLEVRGVNKNQGAESILSLLAAWQQVVSVPMPMTLPAIPEAFERRVPFADRTPAGA